MRILCTGGAGFIGSNLCHRLLELNNILKVDQVVCLDNLSAGTKKNISGLLGTNSFKFIKGDVKDKKLMHKLIKNADIVFHLAALVGVESVVKYPLEDMATNYEGTKNIVEECFKLKKKIVFTSSSEVYGKNNQVPLSEDSDCVFGQTNISRWVYGHSKALSEHLIHSYGLKGLEYTILRYFNIYGPGGFNNRYANVIPLFIKQALKNEPLTIYGDGTQSRAFCYIDDCIQATIYAAMTIDNDVVNMGRNDEITIEELAKLVIDVTASKSKIKHVKPPYKQKFEDSERRVPDVRKINKLIGWKAETTLIEGLSATLEAYDPKRILH